MPKEQAVRAADFQRLAPKRLEAALERLRIFGNLASTYSYAYSPDEIEHMIDELHAELDRVEREFVIGLRRQGADG